MQSTSANPIQNALPQASNAPQNQSEINVLYRETRWKTHVWCDVLVLGLTECEFQSCLLSL